MRIIPSPPTHVVCLNGDLKTPPFISLYRRTPLHFASAKLELMECSILLLEYGAHVMTSDVLGLQPFDLNPVSIQSISVVIFVPVF